MSHRLALLAAASAFLTPNAVAAQRPAVPLDTVRVVSRTEPSAAATRSVEVIGRRQIERGAARSLAELIAFAAGADVQVRSPAQADISLRGSTFNQVAVLVDGVRVNDVQSGHYSLDLAVPTAMIERIEILRGGGSALHGSDAVGGVVNIVTTRDAGSAAATLRGGSFGGASGALAASTVAGGVVVRAGGDVDRSDGHRPDTDYRIAQVRLAAERPVAGRHVVAEVGHGVRHFGAADFYSPFPSEEATRSTTMGLRVLPGGEARVATSLSLHHRRHSDLFTLRRSDPAFYQNLHVSNESSAELSARARIHSRATAVAGVSALDARLASVRLGDHAQRRLGLFGQLTAALPRGATADAGLRQDWLTGTAGYLSPSLGVAIPLSSSAQLRASTNRGFRAPTWTERYYVDPANIADSTLGVERFWSHEVGMRFVPSGALAVDVALYERRAHDLIDWARPAGATATTPWRTRNVASARYRGVEAAVHLPALLGVDWTLRGAGLTLDATVEEGTTGKYALRPLTRTAGVSATRTVAGDGSLTMDALRARRAGEADYLHVNSRLVLPWRAVDWSVELVNLTGARYLDGAGKAVAGRSVFAGVTWRAR